MDDNMRKILDQYNIQMNNMFASHNTPKPISFTPTPISHDSSWVNSWKPTTAAPTAKAALTSIQNNAGIDAKSLWQNTLHGLGTAIDYIDRFRNAADSALYEFTRGQGTQGVLTDLNPVSAIINGFQKDKTGTTRFENALRGAANGFMGNVHHGFGDVLDNAGWKVDPNDKSVLGTLNRYAHNTAGFVGDVATDPLTYLSFGSEAVAKTALKPFVTKALEEAAQKGAVKGTEDFAKIWAKHVESDAAKHAVNTAQAKANKALINVGVPFGKKVTVLNKPAAFQKQTQLVSTQAASSLADTMRKAGLNDAQRYDLISHIIGRPIQSTKELNTQEYDFVNNLWHSNLENSAKTHMNLNNLPDPFGGVMKPTSKAPKSEWENFLNTHWQTIYGTQPPVPFNQMTLKDLKHIGTLIDKHLTQVKTNQYQTALASAMGNVKNDFNALGKTFHNYDGLTGFSPATKKMFVKDNGNGALEATKLGTAQEKLGNLFGSRRFVSTASKMMDHRTATGLGHILNAGNKAYAYSHQAIEKLKEIAKTPEFKSLSKDDWKEVAYTIEGKRPSFAGYVPPTPQKQAIIDRVAHMLAGDPNNPTAEYFMKHINDIEAAANLARGNRPNYFPHVYNIKNPVDFQALQAELLNMGNRGKQIAAGLKHGLSGFQKGRTQFETMADLTDTLHNPNASQELLNRYKDVSWNPLEAYGKRAINGMHQVAKKESIDAVVRDGLALNKPHTIPNGWEEVGSRGEIPQGSPLEALKGKIVPKEIHNDLMKVNKLLTNDAELNKFVDHADKVLSILRRNYTVTKVGFHVRQSIGNIFQNTLAGVTPPSYGKAIKYLANPDKYPEWTKELMQNGIIHTGTSGADLANNLGEELSTGLGLGNATHALNPVSSKFLLARAGRKAGEYEDNVARVAHFLYMRSKGLSQQAAADSVRKYLFNYSEISTSGQMIRRVVPFYQWMRNNLPFQIVNSLKNPKAYNIAQNLLRDFQDAPDSQTAMTGAGINNPLDQATVQKLIDENGGVLPKYIQDNYVNTPWGYYSIALPTQDLKQATHDPAAYFFGSMNPYLSLVSEMMHNENSLNGAAIDKAVPKGQGIWTTGAGVEHVAETALGSPMQVANGVYNGLTNGDWSNILKGLGAKTQAMDSTKGINNLLYQKALELNTKAKALKQQNGGKGQ